MVESRWLRWFGPGVVALGAVGLIASTTLGAGTRPWDAARLRRAAGRSGSRPRRTRAATAWPSVRGAPVVPPRPGPRRATGRCAGQRLALGLAATGSPGPSTCRPSRSRPGRSGASSWSVPMTASARRLRRSTSPPAAPGRSPTERDVIRRATIDPAGDRDLRDAGRSRDARRPRDLAPADRRPHARPARSSPPPAPDGRFGRTCVDRVHLGPRGRPAGGPVLRRGRLPDAGPRSGRRPDRPRSTRPISGRIVGVDGGPRRDLRRRAAASPARSSRPTSRTGGRRIARAGGGPGRARRDARTDARLVHETDAGAGRGLRSVALDGGRGDRSRRRPRRARPPGRRRPRPTSATRLPPGWVLLAPDGRMPADGRSGRPELRHIPDGVTVPLD